MFDNSDVFIMSPDGCADVTVEDNVFNGDGVGFACGCGKGLAHFLGKADIFLSMHGKLLYGPFGAWRCYSFLFKARWRHDP